MGLSVWQAPPPAICRIANPWTSIGKLVEDGHEGSGRPGPGLNTGMREHACKIRVADGTKVFAAAFMQLIVSSGDAIMPRGDGRTRRWQGVAGRKKGQPLKINVLAQSAVASPRRATHGIGTIVHVFASESSAL